jgi:hypothetical protein
VSGRLSEVRGALNGAGGGVMPGSRLARRNVMAADAVRRTAFMAASGWRASEAAA